MKKKLFVYLLLLQILLFHCFASDSTRLSEQYANTFNDDYDMGWDYVNGVTLTGIQRLWHVTHNDNYYNVVKHKIDQYITDYGEFTIAYDGSIGYSFYNSLDDIRPACNLLSLYKVTADEKYKIAADTVWKHLTERSPRTEQAGFWHKIYYPYQMWLDGIYMAEPFYAEYNNMFGKKDSYDDVVHQITEMDAHTWDAEKKLHYHGWYEGNPDYWSWAWWADTITGTSPCFWGRSLGWFAMGVVDVLDYLPRDHPQRDSVINIFKRMSEGIAMYQDPDSLVWWQVVDQAKRDSNWIESSSSCMFVYALAKGVRMGYLDTTYLEVAKTGYQGILDKFLVTDYSENLIITNVCVGTGVGDSYAYYVGRDHFFGSHVDGPFIMASIEMELLDSIYPPGPLCIDSVTAGAICISWNINHDTVSGFILEQRDTGPFTQIADLPYENPFYMDTTVAPNTTYQYRVRSYNANDTSSYSDTLQVTSTNAEGLPSPAFLPFPADSAVNVGTSHTLKWRRGLLAKSHKLYFGTSNPPPFITDTDVPYYDPDTLHIDSIYYWRIDEVNEKGITPGELWKFTMKKSPPSAIESQEYSSSNGESNLIGIYPNPANNYFNIYIHESLDVSSIFLYDTNGRLLKQVSVEKTMHGNSLVNISTNDLQNGIYLLKLISNNNIFYKSVVLSK